MPDIKHTSRPVILPLMGLLLALLYAGVLQASCTEELSKLKSAASGYKSTVEGRTILPSDVKSLLRERYEGKFAIRFDTETCLKTELTYPMSGGYEQLCAEYKQIRKKLGAWYNRPASAIEKQAYNRYKAWNERWVAAKKECFSWDMGYEYMHQDQIDKLTVAGQVPSKKDR